MTIAYIANDPASGAAQRQIAPAADRPPPHVGFAVAGLPAEQVYPADSKGYAAWTARQAALSAIAAFEACCGPLKSWQGTARLSLPLNPDAGTDLNAYYDRASISFFDSPVAGKTFYSGASQDVVAHETGHAILDALKPDLWDAAMMEVSAFHEGFGDCVALLTVLADQPNRAALLAADPTLAKANSVEALCEALAAAIGKAISPTHNAALPRHARSDFQWALPTTLPDDGPGTVLINEMHSLGQLLSGTFYRTILGIFARTKGDDAGLWQATQVATWLLANAVLRAPVTTRYFQSVGRSMLALDAAVYKGANSPAIRAAYAHHNIDISATTLLTPRQTLGAAAFAATGAKPVAAAGSRDLAAVFEAPAGAKPAYRRAAFGDRAVAVASIDRPVDISGLDPRLAGAVAVAPQEAFVGDGGGRAALLGAVDTGGAIAAEVRAFVATLLRRDDIAFAAKAKGGGAMSTPGSKTHAVLAGKAGTAPQLRRVAFACGCGARH